MYSAAAQTKIYRNFQKIEEDAYHTIVRFYQAHEKVIPRLPFDDYFHILTVYCKALFQIGSSEKHLKIADDIIRISIEHNIQFFRGEDIYFQTLLQKSASHYNLREFEQSKHILKELIKIAPFQQLPARFLERCINQENPIYIRQGRAASIVFFIATAVIIATEVMYIIPFVPESGDIIENIRIATFGIGILTLLGTHLYQRITTKRKVRRWVNQAQKNVNSTRTIR